MELGTDLSPVATALAAMTYLMVKHWIADFVLQTDKQRREKGKYGAPGGLTHAATHVLFTLPVFLLLADVAPKLAALILAAEFVVHYHIDWGKENLVRSEGWTAHDTPFWWAIGFDQMLHGLTYVAIVWVATSPASAA